MKKLLRRWAAWLLKDTLLEWQKLHNESIHFLAYQNALIRQLNNGVKLNHLQIDRLNAELHGELH